jgi:hypothetical protein
MILESILSSKRNLFWFIFHVILGFICTFTPYVLIIWFYIVLFTGLNSAILNLSKGKPFLYISLISYLIGFEMLGRMSHAYPFIPTELSKYFIIIFSILGISITKKSNSNWLVLGVISGLLLFVNHSNDRVYIDIVNNYLGFLAICLVLSFVLAIQFYDFSIQLVLKLLLYAIIPSLIYSFLKTPDFEDIEFTLGANFSTSGGAATNQVSTVFGLGLVICFYFLYKRLTLSGNRFFDLVMCLAFLGQGLLTFSRGGIIVGFLAIIALISLSLKINNTKNLILVLFIFVLTTLIFNYIDDITSGKLSLRYQGETEGTYKHGAEKDLRKITSGRSMIFEEDLKLWADYPIFGCGVGISRYIRGGSEGRKISSHIELSRLLAEQGIIGLFYFLALLNIGIRLWKLFRIDNSMIIYFILFLIGMCTTFHAAMRTFVTPLLIGLSVIGIQSVKRKNADIIHRSN